LYMTLSLARILLDQTIVHEIVFSQDSPWPDNCTWDCL